MDEQVKVNLIFIRHGFSCANKIKKFSKLPFRHSFYQDPELTTIGIKRSIENGHKLKKKLKGDIHLLASSSMIRSIETAYYMFNSGTEHKKSIYVLPYVCEKGIMPDNFPLPIDRQSKELSFQNNLKINPKCTSQCIVDYRYVANNFIGRHTSSYRKFIEWMGLNLPSLMKQANREGKDTLNIVVVTHSHFLNKYVHIKPTPLNNEAYHNSLIFHRGKLISDPYAFKKVQYDINTFIPDRLHDFEPERCRKKV